MELRESSLHRVDGCPWYLCSSLTRGKIVEIDVIADPARLRQHDLAVLGS
jgi:hypothetical protein